MISNAKREMEERLKDPAYAGEYGKEHAKMLFANLLTKARRSNNMTQEAFSKKLKRSQPFLAKLESGEANPTIGYIGMILGTIGLQIDADLEPIIKSTEINYKNWLFESDSSSVKFFADMKPIPADRQPVNSADSYVNLQHIQEFELISAGGI